MNRRQWLQTAAGAAFAARAALAQDGKIAPHPTALRFPRLQFDPPDAGEFRRELSGGAVGYFVEDHQLPLVHVSLTVRTGGYLVPAGHLGLGSMAGEQIRAGGTTTLSAREFDEETAFLATEIGSSIGSTSGRASVDCLKVNLDASLKLFFDMLKNPGFEENQFQIAVARRLQAMARRNDETGAIAGREFARLLRGEDHFSTRQPTKSTVESLTIEQMRDFHRKYYHPASFYFAVSGDFDTAEMVERLSEALSSGWPGEEPQVPPVPAPRHTPQPGVYMVDKPDVNQSNVSIGHLGIERSNPDHIAVGVMNDILGGGGFISRIMSRVRSDEGLAYSAGSSFSPGTYYKGVFQAGFQSRNPTCAEAAAITLEEIRRMREEKVTQEELETSKNYAIEIFPRFFATARQVAGTFASDEYTDREEGYWQNYRERVAAVTVDDVLRVSQKYLRPEKAVILAVGNAEQMLAGNPDKPQYRFEKFAPDGSIHRIPLPDPLTMEYPEA